MHTRRDAIRWSAGGIAAGLLGGLAAPLHAQNMVPVSSLAQGNFNTSMAKVLTRSERIVVPSYRFGVVMRSGLSATGNSGSVRIEAAADLVGVDLAALQVIADQAFRNFIARLRSTGRTVIGWEEITSTKGFAKIERTPVPFLKKPFADARTVALVSPDYLPLVSIHTDTPLSDQSPLQLGNWRALNSISAELKSLVMIPSIVLDFAALTGSGHSVYGGAAGVGVQPGLYLVPLMTQFNYWHAKIALAGEGGRLILEDRVSVGQAGELVQTSSYNNRDEIERWNSYVNSMAWWNDPSSAGPLRPTGAYDYSSYQYRVQPEAFAAACLDGARAAHGIYIGAVDANRSA